MINKTAIQIDMPKTKFDILESTCVPLPLENVDTDQIIPARFLSATTRDGFGENLFRDWRYDKSGNKKKEFVLNDDEAAKYLSYGFGSGAHESTGDHTCGSHMCSVSPEGSVSKCGFFEDRPAGDVNDLRSAWEGLCRKYLFTLDELECRDCTKIHECRGGCRFRAERYRGMYAPDPVMCHANGVLRYL